MVMAGPKFDIFGGSGCGSVGRAVASDTRDPQFETRHPQNFIYQLYNRKEKKKKRGREWPILKKFDIF